MSTHYFTAYPKTRESFRVLAECLAGTLPHKLFTIIGNAGRMSNNGSPVLAFGMDTMDPLRVIRNDYGFPNFHCRIVCNDNGGTPFEIIPPLKDETRGDYLGRVAEILFPVKP